MPGYVRAALAIQKLLVANRGEIALRIIRAARELGIEPVAVVAPDDRGSLHGRSAGETVEIRSYLDSEEHIRAAKESGADVEREHGRSTSGAGPERPEPKAQERE